MNYLYLGLYSFDALWTEFYHFFIAQIKHYENICAGVESDVAMQQKYETELRTLRKDIQHWKVGEVGLWYSDRYLSSKRIVQRWDQQTVPEFTARWNYTWLFRKNGPFMVKNWFKRPLSF